MKKIFISFLISVFFNTCSFAIEKMYYCIELGATGFEGSENYIQKNFKTERFKAKIDLKNYIFQVKKYT